MATLDKLPGLDDFGQVNVALALGRRLELHRFFEEQARRGRKSIDWVTAACNLSVGRFCENGVRL
ncbi:MAG: hypothetical protein KBC66_06080 [Kiritimatiellae bacterium]|nr:hypothetical protein [Kiritimatiellia bacterium]